MTDRRLTRARARTIAVVAVAVALLAGCTSPGPDVSPSPSATAVTPTPSASPSPVASTDAAGRALPGFVTTAPDLPDALPAPPGIVATTTPGWVLATYRPAVYPSTTGDGTTDGFAATVQVVYLVGPDGARYQLLELDPTKPIVVDSWSAGDTIAYVRACDPQRCDAGIGPELSLDLLTGSVSPLPDVADDMHVGATLAGGLRWWQNGSQAAGAAALERNGGFTQYHGAWAGWSASPSGQYLAVRRTDGATAFSSSSVAIVDTISGVMIDIRRLLPEPMTCAPFRWRTGDILDVTCFDSAKKAVRVFSVGAAAGEARENKSIATEPVAGSPFVEPDFYVTQEAWAGPYTAAGAAVGGQDEPLAGLARDGKFEPLPLPSGTAKSSRVVAAVGGAVYLESTSATGPGPGLTTAARYDVASGDMVTLVPIPPSGTTRGLAVNEGAAASGLTSWVVAP